MLNNDFYELSSGQKVTTVNGATIIIDRPLGEGTQGIVYRAEVNGEPYALKWYYPAFSTQEQQRMLEMLIRKGTPNEYFLWPLDLVTDNGLGYLMPLRPSEYKSLTDLVGGKLNPTFFNLVTGCFELVNNFMALHSGGYSYGDISFGNIFLNENTGEILICDNDNVSVNKDYLGSVLGTPKFMAPEIVRGQAVPSTDTDQFSLSVLLFCLLFRDHPFDGQLELDIHCMDEPAMRKLYGNPVYIFSSSDSSNRPVPGIHDSALVYYPIYPVKIKQLFEKAFTEGLDPLNRIQETQWKQEFIALRDSIVLCSHCGKENFYDVYKIKHQEKLSCWCCQHELYIPPRIKIGQNIVILNRNTNLYPHHLKGQLYNFSAPLAKISQHPSDKNRWGLTNLSQDVWHIKKENGKILDVPKGKNVPIANGLIVEFGEVYSKKIIGEIRC